MSGEGARKERPYDLDEFLHYEFDHEVVELMRRVLPGLKRLYDILEDRMVEAAYDESFGAMFVISWLYGDVSSLVTRIETTDVGSETKDGWQRALSNVREELVDGLVMHVDTLRLLDDDDWEDMKRLRLSVGSFSREEDSPSDE